MKPSSSIAIPHQVKHKLNNNTISFRVGKQLHKITQHVTKYGDGKNVLSWTGRYSAVNTVQNITWL